MRFEQERSLGKDSLWVLIAKLAAQGGQAVFTILIARRLGSQGFGEYAFIASAVFIGNIITTFGTDMLLIREIAAKRDFSQFIPSLLLQLSLSIVLIVIAWLLPPLPGQSQTGWLALKIFSLSLIPFAFFTVFSAVLRGLQRMDLYAGLNLSISLFQLAATFLFIDSRSSVVSLAWLLVGVQTSAALFAGWLCRDQFVHFRRLKWFSGREFQAVLPLAVLSILGIVYQSAAVLMVTFLLGAVATGYFSAAKRVVEFAKTAHLAIYTALYPAMAKPNSDLRASPVIWLVLIVGALAAALLITLTAAPLVQILYGKEYLDSIQLLRLLPWLLIPYAVGTFLSLMFVSAKQEKPVLIALAASLLTLFVLNLLWTPSFGIIGAGWAFILAESIHAGILLVQYIALKGALNEFPQPA